MNEDTAVEMEWNNSQFDENLPYVEYSISGFRGSVISGEERRFHSEIDEPVDDELIRDLCTRILKVIYYACTL